jgi:hypothetical protein
MRRKRTYECDENLVLEYSQLLLFLLAILVRTCHLYEEVTVQVESS